ncbi:MAG TPA: protein kinase [Gemmatimonadales bacterium]|nr:protein kinase [Gemmatimonadales bacterium]
MTTVDSNLADALRDRYVLERELGRGGMATVYLAQDVRHHRQVAVKVLRPELAATLGSDRFFREIDVAARLQHPHILPLLDSGEAGGFYFYVMPYIAGESLRERLARVGEFPVDQAIKILAEVVDALAAAHALGVVHRDIKPDNVMLSGRHALVMDFGVAKALSEATGRNQLTTAGVALGTPAYMAPEQAAADPHLDHRVDIYAVGTMGYELLTGHPPFSGGSSQEILAAHITRAPEPITARRPAVPPALAAVIMRCLEKRPADRYQTAEELLAQLEPLAMSSGAITPTQTRPVEAVGAKRVPGWVKPVGAVLAGVVVFAAAVFALNRPSDSARPVAGHPGQDTTGLLAVLPFETIGGDTGQRYFTAGMTEEIAGQLSKMSALRLVSATATESYLALPDRLPRMGRELGVRNVVEGSVRLARERVRVGVRLTETSTGRTIWSDQYDRDLTDVFAVQSEVAHQIAEALQATLTPAEARRIDRAPTSNLAAYELYRRAAALGAHTRAANLAGIELLQQAIRLDSTFATAHAWRARRFMFLGMYAGPAYFDSGMVAVQRAIALEPELAIGHFFLAGLRASGGRLTEARLSYLKALELDPNLAWAMVDLSENESLLGRYDESYYWARRAVPLLGHQFLTYHHLAIPLLRLPADQTTERWLLRGEREWPDGVRLQIQLAWLDVLRGREQQALERMRRIMVRDPDNDEGTGHLAELAALTGAPDAEALLLPLVADQPSARPTIWTSPESFGALLALVLHRRGQQALAATLWSEALAADSADLARGHDNPDRPMEIAAIHAVRGETAAALEWLKRGYEAGWRDYRITRRDPFFAGLREEPRFRALLARMESDVSTMQQRALSPQDSLLKGPSH